MDKINTNELSLLKIYNFNSLFTPK